MEWKTCVSSIHYFSCCSEFFSRMKSSPRFEVFDSIQPPSRRLEWRYLRHPRLSRSLSSLCSFSFIPSNGSGRPGCERLERRPSPSEKFSYIWPDRKSHWTRTPFNQD